MAICRLMIEDFMHGTGRYPECFNFQLAYTDEDLKEGIAYAEWLKDDFGYSEEPFYEFNLDEFIHWVSSKLRSKQRRRS